MPPTPDFHQRRQRSLEVACAAHGAIDAVILCDPQDIQYLTGTREGISWLVVMESAAFAVSRHMLVSEVRAEATDCEILLAANRSTERPDVEQFVISKLSQRGLTRVVVDPARLSAQSYFQFAAHATTAGLELCALPDLLSSVRAVKDETEIALTRRCVEIAESAFRALLEQGAGALIGRTERELADELEVRMWAAGADRQGFPGTGIIVASGPHSASAHHRPGARRVAAGEALLIDWGAEVAGYRSDTTRTVFLGRAPEFARRAYPIVEQALHRAADSLRAGIPMGEIDRVARDTITAAGYPEFHYGIGHGVGLAIHEAPWLRADATAVCRSDMLTTIEPGVYLPGVGGIRIENLYRVTDTGNECLGNLPTALDAMIVS
jgi:Xaa-Pro aminopeptidase